MFDDVDKKLMKYFKRKQESPIDILMKLMKKDKGREVQKSLGKDKKDKDNNN